MRRLKVSATCCRGTPRRHQYQPFEKYCINCIGNYYLSSLYTSANRRRACISAVHDSGHKRLLRSIFRMYGNRLPYFWSNVLIRKSVFCDFTDKDCCCCRTGVKMMYRRCLWLWWATAVVPVA